MDNLGERLGSDTYLYEKDRKQFIINKIEDEIRAIFEDSKSLGNCTPHRMPKFLSDPPIFKRRCTAALPGQEQHYEEPPQEEKFSIADAREKIDLIDECCKKFKDEFLGIFKAPGGQYEDSIEYAFEAMRQLPDVTEITVFPKDSDGFLVLGGEKKIALYMRIIRLKCK